MPTVKGTAVQAKPWLVQATFKDRKALKDLKVVTPKDLKVDMQGQGITPIAKASVALRGKASYMETGLQQRQSTLTS